MNSNPITNTRRLICKALARARWQLPHETATLEIELTPDAMLYVDVLAHEYFEYTEIEIKAVEILKDTYRRNASLPNIAEYIGRELDKAVREVNKENYEDAFS